MFSPEFFDHFSDEEQGGPVGEPDVPVEGADVHAAEGVPVGRRRKRAASPPEHPAKRRPLDRDSGRIIFFCP